MRKTFLAVLLAAGMAAPLAAQAPAVAPAQQPADTPADRARAVVIFRMFSVAINSTQVQTPVKNQLATCLYNNPLRSLSVAAGQAFARNPSLDATKPEQVYAVAAQLCGVRRAQPAAAGQSAPAAPAPAPTQPAPTGR